MDEKKYTFKQPAMAIGLGAGIGTAIGVAFGAVLGNVALGAMIGLSPGVAVAIAASLVRHRCTVQPNNALHLPLRSRSRCLPAASFSTYARRKLA